MHDNLRKVAVAPAFQPQGAAVLQCPFFLRLDVVSIYMQVALY